MIAFNYGKTRDLEGEMNSKIIGFTIAPFELSHHDIDIFNSGLNLFVLKNGPYYIYMWGIGDVQSCKINNSYSMSFPLSDNLLDRNVLIKNQGDGIEIENDWLASIPVFYNEKTKVISTLINKVIQHDNIEIDEEGLKYYLEFGYSVFTKTAIKNVRFLRYFSKIRLTENQLVVVEKEDPVFSLSNSPSDEQETLKKIHTYIKNAEEYLHGDIIIPTSGGYDSRLLNILVGQKERIHSFTYGISENQANSSEVVVARELSRRLGTKWKQIELGEFNKYIPEWFFLYGISTHAHGMYHIETYLKMREYVKHSNVSFLSGIVGDAWAGNISFKKIESHNDLINLGYTHGLDFKELSSTIKCEEVQKIFFYEKYSQQFEDHRWQPIITIRLKIILISYLMNLPDYFGFPSWTPYLNFDIVNSMLNVPKIRWQDRKWQKDFFIRCNLDMDSYVAVADRTNTLDSFSIIRSLPERLNERKLSYVVSQNISSSINSALSEYHREGTVKDTNKNQKVLAYYNKYMILKPLELLKNQVSMTSVERPSEMAMTLVKNSQNKSIVFLTTYYPSFLNKHYSKNPKLISAPYQEQLMSLQSESFGDSDFYSEGLKKAGWNSDDIIINCPPLQQAWAKENNFSGGEIAIVIEQIRRTRPQVVYLHDIGVGSEGFISAIRPYTELIVGQIACPLFPQTHYSGFDIIFSSFPHFVERFRRQGITSYWQPLAFDQRVLKKIGKKERVYPVTFVGGISPAHGKGKEILEKIAESLPVEFWGYGAESLPENSPIRQRHHGEAWGIDMFSILSQARITINRHIDVAENYANNMRLFEATGCGTLLITDYKDNLNELFEIGKEVVAYRSPEECAALVKYYLAHPDEAEKIAKADQESTLRDHTYTKRMEQTAEILERHLRYKREQGRFPMPERISDGHSLITTDQISENMILGWKSEKIPVQQRGLVQNELESMYKGKVTPIFQVLADCLRPYIYSGCSVLEIGCASGYYYEILEYLLNKRIAYTGADYSQALIAMAKNYYPKPEFYTADGANLPFENERFFIAISSCMLLHVPNYREHIRETVRVAKKIVVAHRTPICRQRPTQYFKKMAYGVETVELCFNENEIVSEFLSHGLKYIGGYQYYTNPEQDRYEVTYIFEKSINRLLKNAG